MVQIPERLQTYSIKLMQTSVSGLLVLPFLLVGLLNFPTSCLCGAEMPHSHSLFMLGGHHHGHSHRDDATGHEHTQASVGQQGPQLHTPAMITSPGKHTAALLGQTADWTGQSTMYRPPWSFSLLADGQVLTPEPPPPWRQAAS